MECCSWLLDAGFTAPAMRAAAAAAWLEQAPHYKTAATARACTAWRAPPLIPCSTASIGPSQLPAYKPGMQPWAQRLTSTKNRKRGLLRILYMRLISEGQSNASCGAKSTKRAQSAEDYLRA